MNQRIKELERQATETVKCGLNGNSTTESLNRKKFAELIVRECANKVDYNLRDWLQDSNQTIGDKILEHFGIEP